MDIPSEVALSFHRLNNMMMDLGLSAYAPIPIDTSYLGITDKSEIVSSITTLMKYVTAKHSISNTTVADAKKNYMAGSFQHIKIGISFAQQYELDEKITNELIDIYIKKLCSSDFTRLGTLQQQLAVLPDNNDLDKTVALNLMSTILREYRNYEDYKDQNYNIGDLEETVHETNIERLNRLSKQFRLYKPIQKLGNLPLLSIIQPSQEILLYIGHNNWRHNVAPAKRSVPLLAISTDGSTVIGVRKDGTLDSYKMPYTDFFNYIYPTTHRSSQLLPLFENANTAVIAYNKQGTWCTGYNKTIAFFTIGSTYNIDNLHTYTITTASDGTITYLSMLNDLIAITYETTSSKYEYHFFDIQKRSFIEKNSTDHIEFVFKDSETIIQKQLHLTSDNQNFINTTTILNARGLTIRNSYFSTVLDDTQEAIYSISKQVGRSVTYINKTTIIQPAVKPYIDALNICVEKNLQEKQHASLTLDMLYCISTKFHDLAPQIQLSPELQKKVSIPMRTAANPTILNRAINTFLFGNRWIQGTAVLGVIGLSSILWYRYRQGGTTTSPMLHSPRSLSSSATYRKIVPMHRRQ